MGYSNKFKSILQEFPVSKLRIFLGDSLADMLIEWSPEEGNTFSRSKLIEMLEIIHGYSLLKNRDFRKEILSRLSREEILSFTTILPKHKSVGDNIDHLITNIVSKAWGNNKVSNRFAEIIEASLFNEQDVLIPVIDSVKPYDRFYELLDYQFIIKQKALKIINSGTDSPRMLIHMPTGTGKTKTTMHVITNHYTFNAEDKGIVVWLAHTSELLDQAVDSFLTTWRHLGTEQVGVHRLWGNYELTNGVEEINGFLFTSFQKIISISKTKPELFRMICNRCMLVVVDEAHKAIAPETRKIVEELMRKKANMPNRALIGLSATPGRNMDDTYENSRLVNMFEKRIISIDVDTLNQINFSKFEYENLHREIDVIKYLQKEGVLANVLREKLVYSGDILPEELKKLRLELAANGYERDFSKEFLREIGLNKKRNMAILNRLVQLALDKIPTIVFACSVEHGQLLSAALTLRGVESQCVFGNMDPRLRSEAIKRFRDTTNQMNFLINYEVLTTGFDAPNIKCVFITRPTQSIVLYSQMLGRGLRGLKMGGNKNCFLIDIEDNLEKYFCESMAFNYFNNYWGN